MSPLYKRLSAIGLSAAVAATVIVGGATGASAKSMHCFPTEFLTPEEAPVRLVIKEGNCAWVENFTSYPNGDRQSDLLVLFNTSIGNGKYLSLDVIDSTGLSKGSSTDNPTAYSF